jgi:hypothetical protein
VTTRSKILLLAAAATIAGAGRSVATAQQQAPPAASPPKRVVPLPKDVPPDEAAKARQSRIDAVKTQLDGEIAKIDAFGRTDDFKAALDVLEQKYGEIEIGKERWAPVTRNGQPAGYLPMNSVDRWLEWSHVGEGRKVPVALDVTLKDHPFGAIVDMANQLHSHGVEMLLVVFPSRVQLCPELASEKFADADPKKFRGMVGATTRFLRLLCDQGVEVVDLAPDFVDVRLVDVEPEQNGELYLTRNKHWSPRGAELAAKIVSERIRSMPWFVEGAQKEGKDFTVRDKVIAYSTKNGNGQSPDTTPEKLPSHVLRQLGAPVSKLDERSSPIVVLGDSFAHFYGPDGASFPDHLRRFTGWPIDVICPLGGAESQCRVTLARRYDSLRGKKVVVWLLQEENLRPLVEYAKIDLFEPPPNRDPPKSETPKPEPASGGDGAPRGH